MISSDRSRTTLLERIVAFSLENRFVTLLLAVGVVAWGVMVAPFDWEIRGVIRDPVPVDAIPDIGENQQIVFTRWSGRSPQDVEDQISYPLTVSLLGMPGVKTVRSFSMFGFSSIYVIFKEDVEFYWSRSRILEKLASLPPGTLPKGVNPSLGPDATALGQVFWYTLEGRDSAGKVTGGWDLHELRTVQDYTVRYALMAASGVAEVASVGGFVKEYQVDVNPDIMRVYNVTLEQIVAAVRESNLDVGARTIEVNAVEYVVRGVGFVKNPSDLEQAVVTVRDNTPITVGDVARVSYGPALRRGVLDKEGVEAVGGVVVTRYGENPLTVIKSVKAKIDEIAPGLPRKTLADGTVSRVTVVPFYDRSGLIKETLETLNTAIYLEILITVLVILVLLHNPGSSLLVSGMLPLAVLMSFIGMKMFSIDANIVSLSGIAIAIGTIVDMGIVLSENVLNRLSENREKKPPLTVVFEATLEVGGAIVTAVLTTIISFLPVFTMEAAEGKLFKPLAWTKTFALVGSIVLTLTVLPAALYLMFGKKRPLRLWRVIATAGAGVVAFFFVAWWVGVIVVVAALKPVLAEKIPHRHFAAIFNGTIIAAVTLLLTLHWLPVGAGRPVWTNLLFVVVIVGGLLAFFSWCTRVYPRVLAYFLEKKTHLIIPVGTLFLFGMLVWLGFGGVFFFVPERIRNTFPLSFVEHAFPGLGKEFMPPLDEGSFLYMPTTMTHASIGEVYDIMRLQDIAIGAIPEVKEAVGKLGRVESPLDPAPVSMIETIISLVPEFRPDHQGNRGRFTYDTKKKQFVRDADGRLIPDPRGKLFRQWREHIRSEDDIWEEIVAAARIPGVTAAPKLQPIAARIVMLQSGMRAPMGIKVRGPDVQTIERFGLQLERFLKQVASVERSAVFADRIVGKPYLEIEIDRKEAARYGISVQKIQSIIEVALGGRRITGTVEGRERYTVRIRYPRERRGLGNGVEEIEKVLVTGSGNRQIPLKEVAHIHFRRGPQVIKSEDTFLTGYVLFDMKPGYAEVDVVEDARRYLAAKIAQGVLSVPAGVSYVFAGSYENQIRSEKRLALILPVALFAIFLILYFQFRSVESTLVVFAGILVAWSGGFVLIWLYGQEWFLRFPVIDDALRRLFNIHPINLSVAIWVGFLALFGIASDNGVVMCACIEQRFAHDRPASVADVRRRIVEAASRRVRPALMTSATTILALLPILTSGGRGADVMVPMAIPSFGGMMVQLITLLFVPVMLARQKERALVRGAGSKGGTGERVLR